MTVYDLCAIGNALADIIVTTDDAFLAMHKVTKGAMTLVDQARSAKLLAHAGDSVDISSGGSAANTLAGAASLGARCAFMGKVGHDSFGEAFARDMKKINVDFRTPPSPTLPTGHCLVFVTPDAQRSMNTHLGAAVDFGPDDVDAAMIENSAVTYLEGYLFDKPPAQAAFRKTAKLVHQAGRQLSLSLSDTFCVERHRDAFMALLRDEVDILFANEQELKALYQTDDLAVAVQSISKDAAIAVVTRGALPTIVVQGVVRHEVPTHPVETVIDTTGAGDQYAAGFLYGLTHGKSLPEAAHDGAVAAAEVISHFGPRPHRQ